MPKKCIICSEKAVFVIKGTSDFYCESCAEENFDDITCLEKIKEQPEKDDVLEKEQEETSEEEEPVEIIDEEQPEEENTLKQGNSEEAQQAFEAEEGEIEEIKEAEEEAIQAPEGEEDNIEEIQEPTQGEKIEHKEEVFRDITEQYGLDDEDAPEEDPDDERKPIA